MPKTDKTMPQKVGTEIYVPMNWACDGPLPLLGVYSAEGEWVGHGIEH